VKFLTNGSPFFSSAENLSLLNRIHLFIISTPPMAYPTIMCGVCCRTAVALCGSVLMPVLNRYDGKEFLICKNIPGDSTSISGNEIRDLVEDDPMDRDKSSGLQPPMAG